MFRFELARLLWHSSVYVIVVVNWHLQVCTVCLVWLLLSIRLFTFLFRNNVGGFSNSCALFVTHCFVSFLLRSVEYSLVLFVVSCSACSFPLCFSRFLVAHVCARPIVVAWSGVRLVWHMQVHFSLVRLVFGSCFQRCSDSALRVHPAVTRLTVYRRP